MSDAVANVSAAATVAADSAYAASAIEYNTELTILRKTFAEQLERLQSEHDAVLRSMADSAVAIRRDALENAHTECTIVLRSAEAAWGAQAQVSLVEAAAKSAQTVLDMQVSDVHT